MRKLAIKSLAVGALTVALAGMGVTSAAAQSYKGCTFEVGKATTFTTLQITGKTCSGYQFAAEHGYYQSDNTNRILYKVGNWVYAKNALSKASAGASTFWGSSGWRAALR